MANLAFFFFADAAASRFLDPVFEECTSTSSLVAQLEASWWYVKLLLISRPLSSAGRAGQREVIVRGAALGLRKNPKKSFPLNRTFLTPAVKWGLENIHCQKTKKGEKADNTYLITAHTRCLPGNCSQRESTSNRN